MRTTIRLPDGLYRRAKSAASDQGRTFTAFLEDAVRRALEPPREVEERRYVVDPLPDGGGVQDGVDLDDNRRLADLMDLG